MNKKEVAQAIKDAMDNNGKLGNLEIRGSFMDDLDDRIAEVEREIRVLKQKNNALLQSVFMSGVDTFTIKKEDSRYYFYVLDEIGVYVLLVIEKSDYPDYIACQKWYNNGGVFRIEQVDTLDLIKSLAQGDIK